MVFNDDCVWQKEGLNEVKTLLRSLTNNNSAVDIIVTHHVLRAWKLVSIPLAGEYPGSGRVWNRDGARLAFEPSPGEHGSWDLVLSHCGSGLDDAVARDTWCQEHGLLCGGDFLRWWSASLIRQPIVPLPYLFFVSPSQNTGKSAFHRALSLLTKDGKGCVELKEELTGTFNDLMKGAFLCVIEEHDLGKDPKTLEAIKNYTDNSRFRSRGMYHPATMLDNYCHFIQTANDSSYCPVDPNDTRIVCIEVGKLNQDIPWETDLKNRLIDEGPAFLHTLFAIDLPQNGVGRLYLPVLETDAKEGAIAEYEEQRHGWFQDVCVLATDGELQSLTGKDLHQKLLDCTVDPKTPGNAGALIKALKRRRTLLAENNLFMEEGKGKFTISRKSLHVPNPAA
jgi:hypothetical protein